MDLLEIPKEQKVRVSEKVLLPDNWQKRLCPSPDHLTLDHTSTFNKLPHQTAQQQQRRGGQKEFSRNLHPYSTSSHLYFRNRSKCQCRPFFFPPSAPT